MDTSIGSGKGSTCIQISFFSVKFYGPFNTVKVILSWSVNLLHYFWAGSVNQYYVYILLTSALLESREEVE